MNLIDIREPDGPHWAAYQAERERAQIPDDPDMVPPWFVLKLARERVAAARVGLELLAPPPMDVFAAEANRELVAVHTALRTIELYLRGGHILDPAVEQVVAGLLGAQEIETERERRDAAAQASS